MAIKPVVRYMLLCDDWRLDEENNRRVTIIGLISSIHSLAEPPYPLLYKELCVVLILTEGYGQAEGTIRCVLEESGLEIFVTRPRRIRFGPDPLSIVGVPFRIRGCSFPQPGLYSVQFWYEGELVEERPMRLR